MSTTRSICIALCAGLLGCGNGKRADRDPPVPGSNANSPRVVNEEDPVNHRPLSTERPSASNSHNDYSDTSRLPGAAPTGGSPASTAPVAAGATAAILDAGTSDAAAPDAR